MRLKVCESVRVDIGIGTEKLVAIASELYSQTFKLKIQSFPYSPLPFFSEILKLKVSKTDSEAKIFSVGCGWDEIQLL